jgi:hypothetical protein
VLSASSGSTLTARSTADVSPSQVRQTVAVAPKRDRRLTLTKIDKRGRFGRRVAELQALFESAISGEISPMRRLKVEKAAQLTAIAELARGGFMRNATGSLSDIILVERRAAAAARALGIAVF